MPASPMPAVFIGHGSPMNTLEQNRYTKVWRALGASLPRPRAILAVSAHWMTRGTAVTAMEKPRTIHDFGGFPRELFEVQYPAPGDPALAERVRELLAPIPAQTDMSWGLDHGTWSVLTHLYPKADIPVVQLSLDAALTPREHYTLATRLGPLRDEDVLIVGSGNVVHNLGLMRWSEDAEPYDWATRFNGQVRGWLLSRDQTANARSLATKRTSEASRAPDSARVPRLDPIGDDALIDFPNQDPDAALSIPTPEHYLPLLYVIAQQGPQEPLSMAVDGIEYGSISMLAVVVGDG